MMREYLFNREKEISEDEQINPPESTSEQPLEGKVQRFSKKHYGARRRKKPGKIMSELVNTSKGKRNAAAVEKILRELKEEGK